MPLLTFEFGGADESGSGDGDSPARLDVFIAASIDGSTRSEVQRWIRDGRVTVNDRRAGRAAVRLKAGDVVGVDRPAQESGLPQARPIELDVVYADGDMAVIDKPAGLTVHPGAGHEDDTLVNGLLARWPGIAGAGDPMRPGIVHRLDKDTSGLMVVALSERGYEALSRAIRERRVTRRYTALVHGRVEPEQGIIDAPVGRDRRDPTRQSAGAGGRAARTHYRVVEQLAAYALLDVKLETGRMHQIRVHLAAIGYPVAGDPTYGMPGLGLRRQFLHASGLTLEHPATGERMEFGSELPRDLAGALSAARGIHAE